MDIHRKTELNERSVNEKEISESFKGDDDMAVLATNKNVAFVVRKDKVDDFLSGTTKGNLQKVLAKADKHKSGSKRQK